MKSPLRIRLRFLVNRWPRVSGMGSARPLSATHPNNLSPLFVRWDLESAFWRNLELFEALLVDALAICLGEWVRGRWEFGDQLNTLEDLGVLDATMMSDWADCLTVRRRLLLREDSRPPENLELQGAVTVMERVNTALSQRITDISSAGSAPSRVEPSGHCHKDKVD